MRQSMKFALAVALGMGLTSLPSLYAEKIYATSNIWFKITTSSMTTSPTTGGTQTSDTDSNGCSIEWTAVPSADDSNTCALDDTKLSLNTSHSSPLTVTPSKAGDTSLSRVYASVTISACDVLPTTTDGTMGLCVYEKTDGSYAWYALDSSSGTATWTEQTTTTAPAIEIGTTYDICLESDIPNTKARWLAKKSSDTTEADYAAITDWITSTTGLANQITAVSFYGSTVMDKFGAQIVREITVADDANPENYKVVVIEGADAGASIFVDPSSQWMTNYKSSMTDYDDSPATAMNAEAANGLTYLQSYVLGLDPTKAVNKPLVNAKQSTDTDTVSFSLAGIDVNSTAGARVTYCVKAYADATCKGDSTTSESANHDETVSLALPTSGTNVKYYKVEITID